MTTTLDEVVAALEAAGTAQNRKVYPRHGAKEPLFGVPYADQAKLAKRIGTDHDLALALWATGIHDARILATRIVDPARLTAKQADTWMRDCDSYVLVEAIAAPVAQARCGPGRAAAWRGRRGEWPASAGWAVTAQLVLDGSLDDAACGDLLAEIHSGLHGRPNRVRHEMNQVVICCGSRASLRADALAVADELGVVEVDHGETGCRTPAARPYIEKMAQRADARVGHRRAKAR